MLVFIRNLKCIEISQFKTFQECMVFEMLEISLSTKLNDLKTSSTLAVATFRSGGTKAFHALKLAYLATCMMPRVQCIIRTNPHPVRYYLCPLKRFHQMRSTALSPRPDCWVTLLQQIGQHSPITIEAFMKTKHSWKQIIL